MIFVLLRLFYLAVLLACAGYVAWRGGRDERIGLAILVIGSLLTIPAQAKDLRFWWLSMNLGLLAVDLVTLAACAWLMLRSDRFWPLYMTAFQLIAVVTDIVQTTHPRILSYVYFVAEGFWAYPWIASLLVGVTEFRTRAAERADDPDRPADRQR